MSTPDSQERLKEEAKLIRERVAGIIKDTDRKARVVRTVCCYAGLITETLLEYEEPDVVMEQAFHRIAELLRTDPAEEFDRAGLLPPAYAIDHDTEIGRQVAGISVKKLTKGLDDLHEIAIALIINDFPIWEKDDKIPKDLLLRLLIETVIASLTFEMATQDFCDLLIEDFISDGHATGPVLVSLAAIAGGYLADALQEKKNAPFLSSAQLNVMNVIVRESLRHGMTGTRRWSVLAPANDTSEKIAIKYMDKIREPIEEFFELIGLEDTMARAVAVAKATGRLVAVVTLEDVGHLHPSVAKSLASAGLILGLTHKKQGK